MGKLKALYMSNYITATVKDEDFIDTPTSKKSISLILWLSFFLVYSVLGLFMRTITLGEEFIPAASAAALLGRDWFSVMPSLDSFGQLLQGIFYLPSMLIFSDPVAQYGSYMITSAAVYSLVPLMAYKMTLRFGVNKTWHRVVAASACGAFPAILGGSRFLLTEPFTAVIGWALFMLFTENGKDKKKKKILLSSVAAGGICALAYLINTTYFSLFVALLIYVIYLHYTGKTKSVGIIAFSAAFLVVAGTDFLLTALFSANSHVVSGVSIIDKIARSFAVLFNNPTEFLSLLGGRAYYFTVASFGFAVAALAIIAIMTISYITKKRNKIEQFYSETIYLFGIMLFIETIVLILGDSFLSLDGVILGQQELFSAISAYPVITGLVFLFFIYAMRYGMTYVRLMGMICIIGITSFAALLMCTDTASALHKFIGAYCQGIVPLNPGFNTTSALNGDTLIYPVLFIFTAFAALVPIICCAKEYAHRITVFVAGGLILYSALFTAVDTAVIYNVKSNENIESSVAVEEFIKRDGNGERPVIAVYGEEKLLAMNMQYFNQSSEVMHIEDISLMPENCYFVTDTEVKPKGYAVLVGRADNISVYVYGEDAVLYHESAANKNNQN